MRMVYGSVLDVLTMRYIFEGARRIYIESEFLLIRTFHQAPLLLHCQLGADSLVKLSLIEYVSACDTRYVIRDTRYGIRDTD